MKEEKDIGTKIRDEQERIERKREGREGEKGGSSEGEGGNREEREGGERERRDEREWRMTTGRNDKERISVGIVSTQSKYRG